MIYYLKSINILDIKEQLVTEGYLLDIDGEFSEKEGVVLDFIGNIAISSVYDENGYEVSSVLSEDSFLNIYSNLPLPESLEVYQVPTPVTPYRKLAGQ